MRSQKVDLRSIIDKITESKRSIIITLPNTIRWTDYDNSILNFRVHDFPKGIEKGDRCYIVCDENIMGWFEIVGLKEKKTYCPVMRKKIEGKFIEQSGPFHHMKEKIPHNEFQGFRYFDIEDYKLKHNLK